MGGQVLEYEAKTIKNKIEERVFLNMINNGYSVDEAINISEISQVRASMLMKSLKRR